MLPLGSFDGKREGDPLFVGPDEGSKDGNTLPLGCLDGSRLGLILPDGALLASALTRTIDEQRGEEVRTGYSHSSTRSIHE